MPKEDRKYLHDIISSEELINSFLFHIKSFNEYQGDLKTKSAVERQLSIFGEAVVKFSKDHAIKSADQIRAFRNRLIHSYDSIDDSIVWVIIRKYLPQLHREVLDKLSK